MGSGLLLVTGPYAINGVPLRRVNQRFCIATSATVDLKGAGYSSVSDKYFAREATKKGSKKTDAAFFAEGGEKKGASEEKKSDQKMMDEQVVKGLAADMK